MKAAPFFAASLILTVLLFNLISHEAVERWSLKLDMTENALYELSDTARNLVSTLETPVKITVFNREEDYAVMLREVLKRYAAESPYLTLEFVDPYENPVLADHYASRGIQVKPEDIVMEGRVRMKVFSPEDMYTFNAGKTEVTGLKAEQQLTSGLLYVNDPAVPSAAFAEGHNERPTASLLALFRENNFSVSRGSLTSLLRSSPDILVIAAPSRDYRAEEIALLEGYMNTGGNALIFLEPSARPFPRLEGFLNAWGITAGKELVFEEEAYTGGNPVNIVPMYAPHEINRYFLETRVFLTMPSSRSLYASENPGTAYDVRRVLHSTPFSYGKEGYRFDRPQKTASDPEGPFSLVMSSQKELLRGQSRLVVAGSRSLFADDLLGFSSYGNAEFLVQTVNWMTAAEGVLHIPPKSLQSDPLLIRSDQVLLLGILISGVIPLFFLFMGVAVFIRRKRL